VPADATASLAVAPTDYFPAKLCIAKMRKETPAAEKKQFPYTLR